MYTKTLIYIEIEKEWSVNFHMNDSNNCVTMNVHGEGRAGTSGANAYKCQAACLCVVRIEPL